MKKKTKKRLFRSPHPRRGMILLNPQFPTSMKEYRTLEQANYHLKLRRGGSLRVQIRRRSVRYDIAMFLLGVKTLRYFRETISPLSLLKTSLRKRYAAGR